MRATCPRCGQPAMGKYGCLNCGARDRLGSDAPGIDPRAILILLIIGGIVLLCSKRCDRSMCNRLSAPPATVNSAEPNTN